MWLKTEGFVERVSQWWGSYQFQGNPSYVLAQKLKALKLERWNKEKLDDIHLRKQKLQGDIQILDA